MSTFPTIFNTTFFVFLGIIVIAIGLLIIYFENKMREQNHKISSMLSLVSSLADEQNVIKFHLNHVNMVGSGSKNESSTINIPINSSESINLGEKLIDVSDEEDDDDDDDALDNEDDEDDDEEDEEEDEDDDEDDDEEEDDDDVDDEEEDNYANKLGENDIKILNINNLQNVEDVEDLEDVEDVEDLEFVEDVEGIQDDDDDDEFDMIETFDIEDIESEEEVPVVVLSKNNNIDLEKSKNVEIIDYKKLSLNKLKSVVLDKGLTTDTSKMKKNDLLKLLGIE